MTATLTTSLDPTVGQLQLFADGPGGPVNWRLLAGNHRESGRGAVTLPDEASCVDAIERLRANPGALTVRVQRADAHRWRWELQRHGRAVAVSGRTFDRMVRCRLAVDQFLGLLADAQLRPTVVVVGARRFVRNAS